MTETEVMEPDVMHELDAYLRNEISLSVLRDRLADLTWDNPDAPQIAHQIEHVIDEAASGHLSRTELDVWLGRIGGRDRQLVDA